MGRGEKRSYLLFGLNKNKKLVRGSCGAINNINVGLIDIYDYTDPMDPIHMSPRPAAGLKFTTARHIVLSVCLARIYMVGVLEAHV